MTDIPAPRSRFYAPLWLPAAILGGLLILTLVIQIYLSWRAHQRLAPVSAHIAQLVRLQGVSLEMQGKLIESLTNEGAFTLIERAGMRDEIQAIVELDANLVGDTPALLAEIHAILDDTRIGARETLILALSRIRRVIDAEGRAHQRLINQVNRAMTWELDLGTATLLALPVGALLLIYLLRRRILRPLNHLSFLMTLLARRDYSPAPVAGVDPMLRPLTENYNAMAARLKELEKEQESREQDLKGVVHKATHALLEQQRTLANAERLAAVGEMMARIAHELRNPLAGMKMACANLREELNAAPDTAPSVARVTLIANEIDRVILVLNSLLDQSRHSPEPVREIQLAQTIADLVTLVQYQIPARIRIERRIPADIRCRVPDASLRQALLNLVLNAQQVIGDADGRILIEASAQDDLLQLRVCDDGPGFPPDMLESGIRAFVTHRPDGTGLGLSMVQRFARAQNGRITLSNLEPRGACVTLLLPCGSPPNV